MFFSWLGHESRADGTDKHAGGWFEMGLDKQPHYSSPALGRDQTFGGATKVLYRFEGKTV